MGLLYIICKCVHYYFYYVSLDILLLLVRKILQSHHFVLIDAHTHVNRLRFLPLGMSNYMIVLKALLQGGA